LNASSSTWLGQVTTGHGFMVLAPTVIAVLSGTMTLAVAFPLLVAGLVGLFWPENQPLRNAATATANDIEATIAAFRGGPRQGMAPPPGPSGIATLALAGISLAACASQTSTQQAADMRAVESGIVCLANTSLKVAEATAIPAPDAIKAARAADALGGELAADPACAPPAAAKP